MKEEWIALNLIARTEIFYPIHLSHNRILIGERSDALKAWWCRIFRFHFHFKFCGNLFVFELVAGVFARLCVRVCALQGKEFRSWSHGSAKVWRNKKRVALLWGPLNAIRNLQFKWESFWFGVLDLVTFFPFFQRWIWIWIKEDAFRWREHRLCCTAITFWDCFCFYFIFYFLLFALSLTFS